MFTCIDGNGCKQTYGGFKRITNKSIDKIDKIAIVMYEGEAELWHITDDDGIDELARYYRSEHGVQNIVIYTYNKETRWAMKDIID